MQKIHINQQDNEIGYKNNDYIRPFTTEEDENLSDNQV